MRRPCVSAARPSGPLGPYEVKNWLTLATLPSGSSGTRHTQLPRVTARYNTDSSGERHTPLGLGTFASNRSSWPDGRVLYLAVTRGNCVWRVPLLPDGSVAKVGQFFTSYGPSGPDGLAVDAEGRLLIANPGLGHVWVLNHRAEPVEVLRGVPGSSTTNLAFGGADRRTLYVTDSTHGQILRATLAAPGLALHAGRAS